MTTQKSAPVFGSSNNPFLQSSAMKISLSPFATENPFAARSEEVPEDAPEGSYTYKLVQSGPAVPAEECERDAMAVEVVVRWGASVLHVAHLTPPRSFYVGEEQGKDQKCDFFLPEEKLGARRMPLLIKDASGDVRLVIPAGATGSVTLPGEKAATVAALRASGKTAPSPALEGAVEVALALGAKAEIEIGGISFAVSTVNAGRAVAGRVQLDGQSLPFQGLSLAIHAGLLAAAALFMPELAMADEQGLSDDQRYLIATRLQAIAEREQDKPLVEDNQPESSQSGGSGAAAAGEAGKMGSTTSSKTNGRYTLAGPKDNTDVRLSRAEALQQAAEFGMIGLLHSGAGSVNAPTARWGDEALGNEAKNALGNLWGQALDEAGGAGGLALTGIGESGGGKWEGVGVGAIGTINHGGGSGDGVDFGIGRSHNGTRPGHTVKAPIVRPNGNTVVSGRLPPEVIQRVVRQNFGRFRLCYENGLRGNPNLQGRVAVRFIINRDGGVMSAENGGSDMPDTGVVSCVTRAFYGLSFPQPESGIVTVTYPIAFSPSN